MLESEVSMVETIASAFSFGVTLTVAAVCFLIIIVATTKKTTEGIAKSHWIHERKVPRFGGVAILFGLTFVFMTNSPDSNSFVLALLLSSVPLALVGFSEDIGKEIKPSLRIAAGFASGFVAVFLTDYWITSIEVPYFDLLLTIPVIAIPLSAFASTTIAHSFNLIDGLNGLCSGLSVLAFLFFGALAFICGDAEILSTMALAASCVLGFWLINVTTGRIFLGDAGAYFLGHTAAWTAIVLSSKYQLFHHGRSFWD